MKGKALISAPAPKIHCPEHFRSLLTTYSNVQDPFYLQKEGKPKITSQCSSYEALTQRHTQLDVDLVCGEDHRRVLVGGRRRREAGVGRRRIPWVTDGLNQV